jgi:hypothetical protein
MSKYLIVLIIFGLGIAGYLGGVYFTSKAMNNIGTVAEQVNVSETKKTREDVTGQKNSLTISNSQGAVVISATLLTKASNELVFEIVMNTHSTDLNQYDLSKIAQLYFGTTVTTLGDFTWETMNDDTHHKKGYLKWVGPIPEDLSLIKLELQNIAEIPSRSFSWDQKEYLNQIVAK